MVVFIISDTLKLSTHESQINYNLTIPNFTENIFQV